mgnify:CR=1 FL=1
MIRVHLSFVPPGGGEVDYGLTMDLPSLPREGDYISVLRKKPDGSVLDGDRAGSEDFIVRRVWWSCEYPDDGKTSHESGKQPVGTCAAPNIECEFAIGPYSSPAHKRAAENYGARGKGEAKSFDDSNY